MESNWKEILSVWVPGVPKPGGSKVAGVVFNRAGEIVKTKTGRPLVTVRDAGGEPTRHWRAAVADFVGRAWGNRALLDEPMFVKFIFYFPRPSSHFGSGRNAGVLRDSAPPFPAVAPDCTKLVRSAEDALTGVLYKDDSRIVRQAVGKFYSDKAGCLIKVHTLEQERTLIDVTQGNSRSPDKAEDRRTVGANLLPVADGSEAVGDAIQPRIQDERRRPDRFDGRRDDPSLPRSQCDSASKLTTAPGDRPGSATRGAAVERHKRVLEDSVQSALRKAGVEPSEQAVARLKAYLAGSGAPERAFATADLATLVEWDQRVRGLRSAAVREITAADA